MMHMHYAPNKRRLEGRIPICGYMNDIDEISIFPKLCTCPECLDWITDPDSQSDGEVAK
jgi:hypothetical protein